MTHSCVRAGHATAVLPASVRRAAGRLPAPASGRAGDVGPAAAVSGGARHAAAVRGGANAAAVGCSWLLCAADSRAAAARAACVPAFAPFLLACVRSRLTAALSPPCNSGCPSACRPHAGAADGGRHARGAAQTARPGRATFQRSSAAHQVRRDVVAALRAVPPRSVLTTVATLHAHTQRCRSS